MNKAQHLAKFFTPLPKAMKPQKVNGRWQSPQLSRRKIAILKKKAYASDKVRINADWKRGEWDPRWEQFGIPTVMRPPKGKKHERQRAEKMAKIQEALAEADDKINENKKRNKKTEREPYIMRVLRDQGVIDN
uniref:Large ribosomal subunit protein mL59 domain-containing protein n=1 Tax=Aplanochytrium stocchinoi TaxID=215587 RepID=A0A7S3PQX0_9STRA|mmetsp:Transcript_5858/g.7386  ORF Transcript_5858/g.7386 Transcript_5858/m.7386 type:complete len:133 (-) Transcript_5858:1356-1754(-)